MYDIIMKKRNGGELSEEEIAFFIKGYTKGEIPDYQVSALMMAIFFQKMTEKETLALTLEMAKSGDMLDLSGIAGIKVDKHSTGGVGVRLPLPCFPWWRHAGFRGKNERKRSGTYRRNHRQAGKLSRAFPQPCQRNSSWKMSTGQAWQLWDRRQIWLRRIRSCTPCGM